VRRDRTRTAVRRDHTRTVVRRDHTRTFVRRDHTRTVVRQDHTRTVVRRDIIKSINDKQNQETTPLLSSDENISQKMKFKEISDVDDDYDSDSEPCSLKFSEVMRSSNVIKTSSRGGKNKKRKVDILEQRSGENSGVLSGFKSSSNFRPIGGVQFIKGENGGSKKKKLSHRKKKTLHQRKRKTTDRGTKVKRRFDKPKIFEPVVAKNDSQNDGCILGRNMAETVGNLCNVCCVMSNSVHNSHVLLLSATVETIGANCNTPSIPRPLPPSIKLRYVVIDGCNVAMR